MRVVSGTAGGRRLKVPEGTNTRPSTDRVREAMFNSLYSLGAVEGANVLDLFAGSGALGIEALSRGASRATFVENDRYARAVIEDNLDTLGMDDIADVVSADGPNYLARSAPYDLLLLDPPYDFEGWDDLLSQVTDAMVVIESRREIDVPSNWVVHRVRRYGGTVVTLATATGQPGE